METIKDILGQKSRAKWLNWRDKNTRFFHGSTIQRRDRNKILRIQDDSGNWLEGQIEVMNGIWNFYNSLYSAEPANSFLECLNVVPNCITSQMNTSLTKPIIFIEVETAVFDLGALKAPGPDGLNGLFFQKNWETIKVDVFKAVQHFFANGVLGEDVNLTNVSLIPKVPHP